MKYLVKNPVLQQTKFLVFYGKLLFICELHWDLEEKIKYQSQEIKATIAKIVKVL